MISNYKLCRVTRGLTQANVEKLAGVPQHRISLIERGLAPRKAEAKKLAKLYGLESDGQASARV